MTTRPARARKIVLWILVVVIVLVAAALVAGQYWIIPSIIRGEIRKSLADVWDGTAEVGDVEFSYFGPVRIASLRLIDRQQRTWVETGEMEFRLGDWPSASPVLQGVRVGHVDLRAHVEDGRAVWPFRKPPPAEEPVDYDKYLDLQTVRIDQITVGTEYADGQPVIWKGLAFAVERQSGEDGDYQLALRTTSESDKPIIAGTVGAALSDLSLELRVDQDLPREAVAAVLDALNLRHLDHAAGHLRAHVVAEGSLADLNAMQARGELVLSDWTVAPAGRPPLQQAGVTIRLAGQRATFADLSAGIAGLTVTGKGAFDAAALQPGAFWAELHVHGPLNLDTLALFAESENVAAVRDAAGRIDADVTLAGHGTDEESLRYGGTAHLKQWNVAFHEGPPLRDLSATVALEGRQVMLRDLSVTVDGLHASGTAQLDVPGWKLGALKADLKLDGRVSPEAAAQLLGRAGIDAVRQASGGLRADVSFSGDAADLTSLQYTGTADLSQWSLDFADAPPVRDLSGTLHLRPDRRLAFRDVSARVGGLRAGGSGHVDLPGWKPRALAADITAHGLLDRQTIAYILERAGVTAIREATGGIDLEVKLTGDLADPNSLAPNGTATLTHWTVIPSSGPPVERFSTPLTIDGRNITASSISATVCQGTITGRAATQAVDKEPLLYSGSVTVAGLDVAELLRSFDPDAGMTRGRLKGAFTFSGDATGIDAFRADGDVHVTDADLWNVPLATKILEALGRTLRLEMLSTFDADVVTVAGSQVRIPEATVGHGITKIELDEVLLRTGEKTFRATAVLVPGDLLSPVLGRLEGTLGKLGTALLTRLVGFRVEGTYAKPHQVSVVPLPFDTVRRLGADFLEGLATGGKDTTDGIRDILDTTLKILEQLSRPKEDR